MFSLKVDDEIELRLHDLRYAEDFFQLIVQNRAHLGHFMDWEKNHQSVEDTIDYIKSVRESFAIRKVIDTQILYRGELAGACGLMIHNWTAGHGEVGYWVGEQFTGKGIATRAAKAVIDYAFNIPGLHKIVIRMIPENEKSVAIAKRLGFKFEGIQVHQNLLRDKYHDMHSYYMLKDDWDSETKIEFTYRVDEHVELYLNQPHHAEILFELTEANKEHLSAWLPWAESATLESTRDYIESGLQQYGDYDGLQCSIYYDGKVCGVVDYHYWDLVHGKTEIGYWLAQDFTGKGIMTRAVHALVDYAFNVIGLHRIEIGTAVGNTKSAAIPERLGFIHEGVLRHGTLVQGELSDLNMYSILSHEWKA